MTNVESETASLPLQGQNFLVTRPDSPQSSLAKMLESAGANVFTVPMIQIKPPTSWISFDEALKQSDTFDWVVFTSRNGVEFCMNRISELKLDASVLFRNSKMACVGKATMSSLKKFGHDVDLVPEFFQSEGLVQEFLKLDMQNQSFWMIQAENPRETLQNELEKSGAQVTFTPVYQNTAPDKLPDFVKEKMLNHDLDWIVFASASAVNNFSKLLSEDFWHKLTEKPKIACLGQITAAAVQALEWPIDAQPEIQDFEHLVAAISEKCQSLKPNP